MTSIQTKYDDIIENSVEKQKLRLIKLQKKKLKEHGATI